MKPIVLASGSPRRKDLLTEAGYKFIIVPPEVEEVDDPAIPIRELTAINAKLKADAVAYRFPDQVIVAADTLVLFEERALGKPTDMAEAREMLAAMNGKTHHVYTAVCVVKKSTAQVIEFDVSTAVTFKNLPQEERDHYHDLIEPLDKAGAYAAQDHGSMIIEKTEGSLTNVIGLPMDELTEILRNDFAIER